MLEARSAAWRGLNQEVLRLLTPPLLPADDIALQIQRHSLLASAYTSAHNLVSASQEISEASSLCTEEKYSACASLLRVKANLALEAGDLANAYADSLNSLMLARKFSLPMDEASSLKDLGHVRLMEEKFDEANSWSLAARDAAQRLGAQDLLLTALGNLGWSYYRLGDSERAITMFAEAEHSAEQLGDSSEAIVWTTASGMVYQDLGDPSQATLYYRRALTLARQIDRKEDVINTLEDLTHVSIQGGELDDAQKYISEVTPLLQANKDPLDALDVLLAEGEIAAARHDDAKAEDAFRTVENDPASQTSMRLGAEHQLARLYESQGYEAAAAAMYKTALTTFEGARDQLKNEDSKLPFLANATSIYDDYIHFLVAQGNANEALLVADQSRARTLAQGLGVASKQASLHAAGLAPQAVAAKAGATLLFYWLGERQSYLWAITAQKTSLFTLPKQSAIAPLVERYRKTLLSAADPLESGNQQGQDLYTVLVAPAVRLIQPKAPVMILADGPLSQLNFETLLVPAEQGGAPLHYWIEDVTLMAAPSLAMLSAAKLEGGVAERGRLLLLGDAVSPNAEYPELPFAALEMREIEKHFKMRDEVVFTRQQASPKAYLASQPEQFSYIHFVSHGVASRTDPLDSAIILSRASPDAAASEDGFKLYAREIMRHPIDARVVTISACYGSGTRAYAGEGLVGLSWAFLRAGAHSTIGALWEVSDNSTPRLMNAFYQGLEEGQSPAAALRQAKLALLHSRDSFRKPFYWAPFQIYTRM